MDYGLGVSANSLELVRDCLSQLHILPLYYAQCLLRHQVVITCVVARDWSQNSPSVLKFQRGLGLPPQGCDCLGTIKYFDGVLTNTKGESRLQLHVAVLYFARPPVPQCCDEHMARHA